MAVLPKGLWSPSLATRAYHTSTLCGPLADDLPVAADLELLDPSSPQRLEIGRKIRESGYATADGERFDADVAL